MMARVYRLPSRRRDAIHQIGDGPRMGVDAITREWGLF